MTVAEVLDRMTKREAQHKAERAHLTRLLAYAQADDDTVALLQAEILTPDEVDRLREAAEWQRAFTQLFPGRPA